MSIDNDDVQHTFKNALLCFFKSRICIVGMLVHLIVRIQIDLSCTVEKELICELSGESLALIFLVIDELSCEGIVCICNSGTTTN